MCLGCILGFFGLIGLCLMYAGLWIWRRPRTWVIILVALATLAWVFYMAEAPCPNDCLPR